MFRTLSVGMCGALVAGCAANAPWGLPDISSGSAPDNPAIGLQIAAYQSIISGYTARVPESPRGFKSSAVDLDSRASSPHGAAENQRGQVPLENEGGPR